MKQSRKTRKAHVDKANALSVKKQCEVLQISRSSHYYTKVPQSSLNLQLMRLIDEEFLNRPWKGVPRMTNWLQQDMGYAINKKRVERLYRLMGLSASAKGPATSKPKQYDDFRMVPRYRGNGH